MVPQGPTCSALGSLLTVSGLTPTLAEVPFVAVDVTDLTYVDAAGMHALARWAQDATRAGRPRPA